MFRNSATAAAAAAANLAAAQSNPGQLALLQQQQLFAQSLAAGKPHTKTILPPFQKSRNVLPRSTVTRSLGSFLRMATRRLTTGRRLAGHYYSPEKGFLGEVLLTGLKKLFQLCYDVFFSPSPL